MKARRIVVLLVCAVSIATALAADLPRSKAPPAFDRPIPADTNYVHFGKGQTEALITLAPGPHRLQLLLADQLHVPHDPPVMSKPITVVVK